MKKKIRQKLTAKFMKPCKPLLETAGSGSKTLQYMFNFKYSVFNSIAHCIQYNALILQYINTRPINLGIFNIAHCIQLI